MTDDNQTKTEESVWDYPRPPRLERVPVPIRVEFAGVIIAKTTGAYRVLETSHPPVYYIPDDDIAWVYVEPAEGRSFCEFKGFARYWSLRVNERYSPKAAWSYPDPTPDFVLIGDYLAFYASRVDACWVGPDRVQSQAGDFYGGWITPGIKGPFKGEPGTEGW